MILYSKHSVPLKRKTVPKENQTKDEVYEIDLIPNYVLSKRDT